jgi:protein-tyrosine kinase
VSKLQSAIHKIAARRKEDGDADGQQDSTHTESRNKRPSVPVGGKAQPKQIISVDFDNLLEAGVVISEENRGELRDSMRRIKWPVLANAFGEQSETIPRGNVVMVASAASGEGKTFTAVNLALSIAAEKDHDVLLVDADIAKPHVSKAFGIMERSGVIDYLLGEIDGVADIVVGTDIPGLSVLPAGQAHEHASELIASSRMNGLVSELTQRFPNTVILFDSSPLLQTNESQVLSRIVGQVLLVVAANKTPQAAVAEAAKMLGSDRAVNVIFNGLSSSFLHKYRYGGYYGYQAR